MQEVPDFALVTCLCCQEQRGVDSQAPLQLDRMVSVQARFAIQHTRNIFPCTQLMEIAIGSTLRQQNSCQLSQQLQSSFHIYCIWTLSYIDLRILAKVSQSLQLSFDHGYCATMTPILWILWLFCSLDSKTLPCNLLSGILLMQTRFLRSFPNTWAQAYDRSDEEVTNNQGLDKCEGTNDC